MFFRAGSKGPRVCISQRRIRQYSGFDATMLCHKTKDCRTCSLRLLCCLVGRVGSVLFLRVKAPVDVVTNFFFDRTSFLFCFWFGNVRQEVVDVKVDKVTVGNGLEVTVKEQQEQGRVKHEKGEGEMTKR